MDPSLVSENVGWSGTAGFLPVRGDSGAHRSARHRVALEVRCSASHCLERTRRRTRSDAVDAGVFVGAWGVGHVLRRTHCKAILVSGARDVPLLQQVLRSGFATSDQLYEFMQLNQSERSRQAFDHRLRRLLAHGLIEKHQGAARGRPQVYVISKEGASLLIDMGELFAGRIGMETGERSCSHWLDLNDLHLALAKAHML